MKPTLNLATRTPINRKALQALYFLLLAVLILVLLLNVALYLRSRGEAARLSQRLAGLEEKANALREEPVEGYSPEALAKQEEEIAFANAILEQDSFRWTDLLDRLEGVIPKAVRISSIEPDYSEKSLRLTGVARKVADLRRFLDNLIASPHFTDVFLLQQETIENRSSRAGGEIRFSLLLKGAF